MLEENKRKYVRTPVKLRVKLIKGISDELILKTANISDGGIFLEMEGSPMPEVGDEVDVQVQGIGGGDAPIVKMKVMRQTPDGVGLAFI